MEILSIYSIEKKGHVAIIKGFTSPIYAGDHVHEFTMEMPFTIPDNIDENIIFSNCGDAHKHAYIETFGEEQYNLKYKEEE